MDKQELETKQKAFAAGLVSVVYAFVIQLTQGLNLVPTDLKPYVSASIFVPAIASILFGKLIGATGAAGGQFITSSSSTLLGSASGGIGAQAASPLTGLSLTHVILIASNFIGAWIVGSLTEQPSATWDTFTQRFTNMQTWSRLFQNTLGSIVGLGMFSTLLSSFQTATTLDSAQINTSTQIFVQAFFLNSLILVIFIPITLLLYEFGDLLVEMRAAAKDKSLRKLARTVNKEEAATIISTRLTEKALTQDAWTPISVKFRANLDQKVKYKIEAVSTANSYPPFDSTAPLSKGEIWEQKFFIMPSKQKNVDFKFRITPAQESGAVEQDNVPETVTTVKAKSHNPNSNSATLVLFSIINSIMVGASIIGNNLLQFNINSALASLRQSLIPLLSIWGLEVIIIVPILMYLRRRWSMADDQSLTVGFGTDLSERSQKVYASFEGKASQFFSFFGQKLQRSMKLFLVFVTTVSVLLLGLEGYNDLTIKGYTLQYSSQLLIIGALAIVLWLGGYKGIDILRSAGLIEEPKYDIQDGSVIQKFKPTSDFFSNQPNEVAFTVDNPTKNKGLRIRFLSQDTVSPPLVEMPVPAGGSAVFKTSVTPLSAGTRNIMVVAYPLFDENDDYIDENSAEPFTHQYINYIVQSETQIGISKDQQSKLKKLLILVMGLVALIYGGGVFTQQLFGGVGGQSTYTLISNNAPYLLALQAPFVYAYFYLQNKSTVIKGEMESILEQINAMDNLAKEMNTELDKSIVNSKTFTKSMHGVLKTTLDSVSGLSTMNQLNKLIGKQVSDSLGENFTQSISKVVGDEDMNFYQQVSSQVITDKFSGDFQKIVDSEKSSFVSSVVPASSNSQIANAETSIADSTINTAESQAESQVTSAVDASVPTPTTPSANASTPAPSTPTNTADSSTQNKAELKTAIKEKIKEQYSQKLQKETSKIIAQELKKKTEDSFVGKYKAELTLTLKKTLSKELRKQMKNEKLLDDIENQILKSLGPDVQQKILDQLNKTVFNRDMLSSIAENLDSQLGTDFLSEFEDTIGTDLESSMADTIKEKLNEKYEKEVMDKLKTKIRRQIVREINKRGDAIIDKMLNTELTTTIENKMSEALQKTIGDKIDSITNVAVDTYVDAITL